MENYLIKLHYIKDCKSKNINDFGILTQACVSVKSLKIEDMRKVQTFEDDSSNDSFNPRSQMNESIDNDSIDHSAIQKRD